MERKESQQLTKRAIRHAETGKEIAEAIIKHFREFGPKEKAPVMEASSIEILNAPLFGLEPR